VLTAALLLDLLPDFVLPDWPLLDGLPELRPDVAMLLLGRRTDPPPAVKGASAETAERVGTIASRTVICCLFDPRTRLLPVGEVLVRL
jgi:hypothetical protein